MNFALIVDACKVESYSIIDNKAYKFRTPSVPYQFHHSVKNESFMGFWGYPFVFGGHFINWSEWGNDLPDLDLDLIFVAIERDFRFSIDQLRIRYPNAKIVSVLKETFNWDQEWSRRLPIYDQADQVLIPVTRQELFPQISQCKRPVEFLAQPVDTEYLYENFYTIEREESIFPYFPVHNCSRYGRTKEFAEYIARKYDVPFYQQFHTQDSKTQWHDFLKAWTRCTFHFNLDPTREFPGQQAMQCAALGVIHIGGINDSHPLLFPETATNDEEILEKRFADYLENQSSREEIMHNAWKRVNIIYSYDAVRERAKEILK